jgi:hypothetical protein
MSLPDDNLDLIVIPECRKGDYPTLLSRFEDAGQMPRTWQEFMKSVNDAERFHKGSAKIVTRVNVHIDDFISWCRKTERGINRRNLHDFAVRMVLEKQKSRGGDRAR